MAYSEVQKILDANITLNPTSGTDLDQVTIQKLATNANSVINRFFNDTTNGSLIKIRQVLVAADIEYNKLMDANGDNAESHYAKTMMLYGRKFCGMDILNGIDTAAVNTADNNKDRDERYMYETGTHIYNGETVPTYKNYIDSMPGINSLFSAFCPGFIEVEWNCWDEFHFNKNASTGALTPSFTKDGVKNTYYRPTEGNVGDHYPETEKLVQKHALGTMISMPRITDLDNFGGTNAFRLKPGYQINGWKLVNGPKTTAWGNGGEIYLIDKYQDDWKIKDIANKSTATKSDLILDRRVFEKPDETKAKGTVIPSSFVIPYRWQGFIASTAFPTKLKFVLDISIPWFRIGFKVPHLASAPGATPTQPPAGAPSHEFISTKLGEQLKLPLATMLQFESGYEVDTLGTDGQTHPYGQWTTIDASRAASAGTTDYDIYGENVPEQTFDCGSELYVGVSAGQIDPTTCAVKDGSVWKELNPPTKWFYLRVRRISS